MDAVRSLLANLSPRGRLALAGAGVAVVVLMFVLFRMATSPSYELIGTGLDPADTGEITAALDERGIAYELRNNGTAVAVPSATTADARVALAESGAGGGNEPGFELFDEQSLGASDFQQQVNYQRALEGELGRTIEDVDGVSDVSVQLTLPEDRLFEDESAQPTAAVLLSGSSGLDPASVRGIAQLTASSVEALDPQDVTITDGSGVLLWPNGEAGAGETGTLSKHAAETRYERELQASLDGLLLRTIGPDKGRVQVQADLDANRATRSRLRYAKRGTPLERSTEEESLTGGGGAAGGAGGAAANIPTYAAGGAAGGDSEYTRESDQTRFGVDKTVTRTEIAPGAVNRLGVALVVDESVPASEVAQLEDAVAAAAGIDEDRGDTMETSRIAFAEPPEEPGDGPLPGVLDAARYVGLALVTLLFLVFAGRHLRRRQEDAIDAEPTWLRELDAPASLAELELAERRADWDQEAQAEVNRDAEEVAAMEPERVAQQLRAWMKEA